MGRNVIVIVVLMSTLYAGIMLSLQRKLLSVPDFITQNMMIKQAEGVNDYALRTAVRNAPSLGMVAGPDSVTNWQTVYSDFKVFDSTIDSIKYAFVESGKRYRARTYVTSKYGDKTMHHQGEIAFDFPLIEIVGNPNCFYLRMNQPQFNPSPHWNHVIDSSPHKNHGRFYGEVDTAPREGADGWKCACFEKNKENKNGYIDHPGNRSMEVNSNFTMVCYAIIRKGYKTSTILWLASDPYDSDRAETNPLTGVHHPGENLRLKPTGGIWYENGMMHFSSTNTRYQQTTISVPFTPQGSWPHNKDKWYFFALSYDNGILKAYIDGVLVGTSYDGMPFPALTNRYGFSIGRKDIRNMNGLSHSDYMYMQGLVDEVGLYNRTLTDAEIAGWHEQIIKPANIQYIKD